jgi:transcriptional regulator with GAF, ATPase, and Fis domain
MRVINAMVERVAATDATVLIWGESGVGKELVARALHRRSLRCERPFVKVNCAALPSDLLESELFGYERGAFTGAHRAKPGKFEVADTGTIFLDEIGEMPLALQAKLLQVLQDGEFSRLGSRRDVRVDVRIVVATNRDLATLVAQGSFRTDLYYRLNVVGILVPPLRQRREEIPALTALFLDRYARRYGRVPPSLSPEMLEAFMEYQWPGNIRELENVVKRIVVLGDEKLATDDLFKAGNSRVAEAGLPAEITNLPQDVAQGTGNGPEPESPPRNLVVFGPETNSTEETLQARREQSLVEATAELSWVRGRKDQEVEQLGLREFARQAAGDAERRVLEEVLTRARWRKSEAARRLKISTKTLLRKMREHGLGS